VRPKENIVHRVQPVPQKSIDDKLPKGKVCIETKVQTVQKKKKTTRPRVTTKVSRHKGKTFTSVVTAYCHCRKCCGKTNGITASGARVRLGSVAASSSIPFGTKLHIPGYGEAIVLDRGGDIKGTRIDVYFPTHKEALRWGRKRLTITIL
jgi:3D (Asp-Asp-Asp) domain-containing protein